MLGYLVLENPIDCAPDERVQPAVVVGSVGGAAVGAGVTVATGVAVGIGVGRGVAVGVGGCGVPGFRHGQGTDSQWMPSPSSQVPGRGVGEFSALIVGDAVGCSGRLELWGFLLDLLDK
jgi:hypothetical protein